MAQLRWMAAGATLASIVLAAVLEAGAWRTGVTRPAAGAGRAPRSARPAATLTEDLRTEAGAPRRRCWPTTSPPCRPRCISTVAQVRDSTDSIETASREVAAGNADLSARTELTASSLQGDGQLHAPAHRHPCARAPGRAPLNTLAQAAGDVARRGGGVVQEVVRTMDEINASSRKISDIIPA